MTTSHRGHGQRVAFLCDQPTLAQTAASKQIMVSFPLHYFVVYTVLNTSNFFRAPSKILWRTVRGMLPHKLKRGAEALDRLKVFEGIPPPYDKVN